MSYSDKYTDKKTAQLERRLEKLYASVFDEITLIAKDYFGDFQDRYDAEYQAYLDGKYTKRQFDDWVQAQIGRGKRWVAIRNEMAQKVTESNVVASSMINGQIPDVFMTNYNYSAYEVEQTSGVAFNIYNERAVEQLMVEEPELFPTTHVDIPKDLAWNQKKLTNALASGIIMGKSLDKIADSFRQVTDMNENSAIRNARTCMTGAQNAGRQKNMEDIEEYAKSKHIDIRKEWVSCGDNRVRDSHAHLDGVRVHIDDKFPNGLLYPADPNGAPAEVYNCRCFIKTIVNGLDAARTANTKESYEKWVKEKNKKGEIYDIMYKTTEGMSEKQIYKDMTAVSKLWNGMPSSVRIALSETKFVLGDKEGCRTDINNMTIYLSSNATQKQIYHEIGHLVEAYIVPYDVAMDYRKSLVQGIDPALIKRETWYTTTDIEKDIVIIKSDGFITDYQGRLYIDDGEDIENTIRDDGSIDFERLGDAFSEPFSIFMGGNAEEFGSLTDDIIKIIREAIK